MAKYNWKHGLRRHSAYNSWTGMMGRCYNPRLKSWKRYGGRGISVCSRWHSVVNFIEDMGEKPPGKSIDRINNDKGYCKSNCRWATRVQQNNNHSRNVRLKYRNESLTISQWSRRLGVSRSSICSRLGKGWSAEKSLGTPLFTKEMFEYRGKSMGLGEWAKHLGVARDTLYGRRARRWPVEKILGLAVDSRFSTRSAT